MLIAQPCPVIVNYIETYQPSLLPYLVPADSPMVHTIKMIKEFYPQFRDCKIAAISPCIAKKREFEEVGLDAYNVTFTVLKKYLDKKNINLSDFPEADYDNPPAERAVTFSSPGGLLKTLERWKPGISEVTRKIMGPHVLYEYLDHLPESLENDMAPLIVDCLNCDLGCNGGTGTDCYNKSADELEFLIKKRVSKVMENNLGTNGNEFSARQKIEVTLKKYWKEAFMIEVMLTEPGV